MSHIWFFCCSLVFCSIYESWSDSCAQDRLELPKGAIAELKKRMKKAGSSESKAKLDFVNCKLYDEHVGITAKTSLFRASS